MSADPKLTSQLLQKEAAEILGTMHNNDHSKDNRLIECIVSAAMLETTMVLGEAINKKTIEKTPFFDLHMGQKLERYYQALKLITKCTCKTPQVCIQLPLEHKCVICIANEALKD